MAVHIFIIILFAAVGTLCILAGALGWQWFLTSRNAATLVRLVGIKAARAVYCLLGLMLVAMSLVIASSVGLLDIGIA